MSRVVVHIERLVLKGGRPGDGDALARGLEQELARLLAEPGAAAGFAARGDRDRLTLDLGQGGTAAGPAGIGARTARGLVGGRGDR